MRKQILMKKNAWAIIVGLFLSPTSFAQEDGDAFREIDPPPTPIDNYVIPFAFVAILIAAFYFYKTNLKTGTK